MVSFEGDLEEVAEGLCSAIDEELCGVSIYSRQDAINMYRMIMVHCREWINAIQKDINAED